MTIKKYDIGFNWRYWAWGIDENKYFTTWNVGPLWIVKDKP